MTSNIVESMCFCTRCKKSVTIMRFDCKFCEKTYCLKHQLPERHNCNIRESPYFNEYKNKNNCTIKTLKSTEKEVGGNEA